MKVTSISEPMAERHGLAHVWTIVGLTLRVTLRAELTTVIVVAAGVRRRLSALHPVLGIACRTAHRQQR